jgi:hypothetical protein
VANFFSAIVGTLNAQYQVLPYGLGGVTTLYPISAFITHLVYLKDTAITVDAMYITVRVCEP